MRTSPYYILLEPIKLFFNSLILKRKDVNTVIIARMARFVNMRKFKQGGES